MTELSELEQLRAEVGELRDESAADYGRSRRAPHGGSRPAPRGAGCWRWRPVVRWAATLGDARRRRDAASGDPLILGSSFNTVGASTGLAVSGTTAGYGIGVTDNGLNSLPGVRPLCLDTRRTRTSRTGVLAYVDPAL